MGGVLDKPVQERVVVSFSEGSLHGAVVSAQGRRATMEDSYLALPSVSFDKDSGFFAIFDGHGGKQSSTICASQFLQCITHQMKEEGIESIPTVEQYSQVLINSFIKFDSLLREQKVGRSGSTAIVGCITPNNFIIANLGDSRCILSSEGRGIPLSIDHKPFLDKEKERILKAGCLVVNGRVHGDLAVSRSFGDYMYKKNESLPPEEQAVSCVPDITIHERTNTDNYIVFACDGVWDVFPKLTEFIQTVDDVLQSYDTTEHAMDALVDICLSRGSKDNITLIIVLLDNPPKPNLETVHNQYDSYVC